MKLAAVIHRALSPLLSASLALATSMGCAAEVETDQIDAPIEEAMILPPSFLDADAFNLCRQYHDYRCVVEGNGDDRALLGCDDEEARGIIAEDRCGEGGSLDTLGFGTALALPAEYYPAVAGGEAVATTAAASEGTAGILEVAVANPVALVAMAAAVALAVQYESLIWSEPAAAEGLRDDAVVAWTTTWDLLLTEGSNAADIASANNAMTDLLEEVGRLADRPEGWWEREIQGFAFFLAVQVAGAVGLDVPQDLVSNLFGDSAVSKWEVATAAGVRVTTANATSQQSTCLRDIRLATVAGIGLRLLGAQATSLASAVLNLNLPIVVFCADYSTAAPLYSPPIVEMTRGGTQGFFRRLQSTDDHHGHVLMVNVGRRNLTVSNAPGQQGGIIEAPLELGMVAAPTLWRSLVNANSAPGTTTLQVTAGGPVSTPIFIW